MRKMNCRSVRREIEEVPLGNLLSASASDHLRDCPQCKLFREDRLKLREMLASLGPVEAPGDFDFRLRARLANEKRGAGQPFVMRNLSFGFRSATVAAMLFLIVSALLFIGLRKSPINEVSTKGTVDTSVAISQPGANAQPGSTGVNDAANLRPKTDGSGVTVDSTDAHEKVATSQSTGSRRTGIASMRGDRGGNQRLKTLEMASTAARVVRAGDATNPKSSNVFPIGASFQSLKVSLDDGRGSSRTISVPSVSFGSQRVLSPGSSSLLASARSDW